MQGQVYKLSQCLDSEDPWRSLTLTFPELFRAHAEIVKRENIESAEAGASIVQLYRTYVQEWETFPGPF